MTSFTRVLAITARVMEVAATLGSRLDLARVARLRVMASRFTRPERMLAA